MAIEDDAYIYGTLMRPIDIMVEKWMSFRDNRGEGERGFTDRYGPTEEYKGATVELKDRSGSGNRGVKR